MKKLFNIFLSVILVLVSCSKNDTPEPAKENVVNSPFKVKYEIITDNNANYNPSFSWTFPIDYNIESGGSIITQHIYFSKSNKMPNIWTKEFTATLTYRPYTLSLQAKVKLLTTGNQYIIGNIYVNDALVATQKGDLLASTNESTINFAWAAQKP